MRLGFNPTSVIVSSEPVRAAAATRNAADDGSPGTRPSKPWCWKGSIVTDVPSRSTGTPSAASATSV